MLGLLGAFRERSKAKSLSEKIRIGGLYSIIDDSSKGTFSIVKILMLDLSIVHLCLYSNKYDSRPENIDLSTLSIDEISIEEDDLDDFDFSGLGIGHLPVELNDFVNNYQPVLLVMSSVSTDDLEGYKIWREDSGGTFDHL